MHTAIMWGKDLSNYNIGDIKDTEIIGLNIKFRFRILRKATKEEYMNQEFKPPFSQHPNADGDFMEVQILD